MATDNHFFCLYGPVCVVQEPIYTPQIMRCHIKGPQCVASKFMSSKCLFSPTKRIKIFTMIYNREKKANSHILEPEINDYLNCSHL